MPSLPTLPGKYISSRMSQLFIYKGVASECFECAIMIEGFTCCGNYWPGFLFQWTVRPSVLGLCSYFLVPGHTHGRDTIKAPDRKSLYSPLVSPTANITGIWVHSLNNNLLSASHRKSSEDEKKQKIKALASSF